jgi:cysteinyl-tRNA synthetase
MHDESILPLSIEFLNRVSTKLSDVDHTGNRTKKAGKNKKKTQATKSYEILKRLSAHLDQDLNLDLVLNLDHNWIDQAQEKKEETEEIICTQKKKLKTILPPRMLLFNPPSLQFQQDLCRIYGN